MKKNIIMMTVLLTAVFISCKQAEQKTIAGLDTVFPKGDKITNDNFKGTTWLNTLVAGDSIYTSGVGNLTFEPGARSNWHSHPAGQILLALDGVGYYQEKDGPKKILRKGDMIKCLPNIAHWHGASIDTGFVQIAITDRLKGPTVWQQPVTEEEYKAIK